MIRVTMLLVICTSRNSASMPWAMVTSRSPAAHTWARTARPTPARVANMARTDATDLITRRMEASLRVRGLRVSPGSALSRNSAPMVCPPREGVKDARARVYTWIAFRGVVTPQTRGCPSRRRRQATFIDVDAETGPRSAIPDFEVPGVSSLWCVQVDRLELRSELRRHVGPQGDGQPVVTRSGGGLLLQRDAHVIGLQRPHGAGRRVDDEIAHAADEQVAAEIPAPRRALERDRFRLVAGLLECHLVL